MVYVNCGAIVVGCTEHKPASDDGLQMHTEGLETEIEDQVEDDTGLEDIGSR